MARSFEAADAGADGADAAAGGETEAGMDAAMLMLRATRTRRPARSISISVRLVSSSSNASSRMSALSLVENFAAALSSGWRAMIDPELFLGCDGRTSHALALTPILAARPLIASR